MNVDVLGPVRITLPAAAGRVIETPGRHTAAAIGYLTTQPGRAVPWTEIAAAVGSSGSAFAVRSLRADLARVADAIPSDAMTGATLTIGATASLTLGPGALDAERFTSLVRQSHRAWISGDRDTSMATTCAALALWRSDPYPELADCLDILPTLQRLRSARLDALELYQEFDIVDGTTFNTVARARQLAAANPERRTLRLQLARALHVAGRHVEALAELRETAAILGDSPLTRRITSLIAQRDPAAATRLDDHGGTSFGRQRLRVPGRPG